MARGTPVPRESQGGRQAMTWYVVVTRDRASVPIKRCVTMVEAGDHIFYERAFDRWTVKVQEGSSSAPMRTMTPAERLQLERRLYPSLYE